MKTLLSLPDINQKEFFSRYANLIPTLFWLGVLAQIVSFATELGIVYNIISNKLLDLPIPMYSETITIISWTAAIIGSLFFEVGLRKFIPYSVRSFLYGRWTGLDKAMSIFILMVAGLLVSGSISLSFKGSKELVNIASKPKEQSTLKIDQDNQSRRKEIADTYLADNKNIVASYDAQISGIESKYLGKIQKQESEIALYSRKEQRTGKSYTSRKEVHRGNIAKLKSEQGAEIAALQASKRKELANISEIKRKADSKAINKHERAVSSIERKNRTAANEATTKANLYGGGLAWFTILCMVVFILSVIIDEVHKKGSGIVEQVLVNQYDFSPSAWSRFIAMAKEKFQQKVHSQITRWEETTPSPTLPVIQHELFDIGNIDQERITVEVEKLPEGKYIVPSKIDKSNLIPPQKENTVSPTVPKEDHFDIGGFSKNKVNNSAVKDAPFAEAKDVGSFNNKGGQLSKENKAISDPRNNDSTHTDSNRSNDKELKPRAVIQGFRRSNDDKLPDRVHLVLDDSPSGTKNDTPIVVEKVVEKIVYVDKKDTKNCLQCGELFTYKSKKKIYCSTKCRQDSWEQKNGKKLKQGRVK